MDIDSRLFVIIASRVPAIWDVIGPVALNPQPLPPGPSARDLRRGEAFERATKALGAAGAAAG